VDWTNTSLLSIKDDMILQFKVGEKADTDFVFTDDLSMIIKTATVTLTNPITNEAITSYVFSATDKAAFMDYSWTPYYRDPRFCGWYDSAGGADKCKDFFIDGVRSNGYHDTAWIDEVMPKECQVTNTTVGEEDDNNTDFFIFTPREWFRDNTQGYVEMKIQVTAVVHKCTDARRVLQESSMRGKRGLQSSTPNAETDVLYISDEIIVSFVTDEDGNEHVEVRKPATKSWVEENTTILVITGAVAAVILFVIIFMWVQKNRRGGRLSVPYNIVTAAKPDF
jgi:hypothetical protein